jgi:transposase
MQVKHGVLKKGQCSGCGRWMKAKLPHEYQAGYGPRFSALVAELSGIQGISRKAVEDFIQNVFDVPISTGGIQKVIDRVSAELAPVHEANEASLRRAEVNHVDETSWQQAGALKWLWTMTNCLVSL